MVDQVRDAADRVAETRNLIARVETLNLDPPMRSVGQVSVLIRATCRDLRLLNRPMVSRAYHDALFMARIAPTAMIFIPSRGGYSHRPEEYSSPEQIATGVAVLAGTSASSPESYRGQIPDQCEYHRQGPPTRPIADSTSSECAGDQAEGLVGGDVDFVSVGLSEPLQVEQDAVLVG